LHVGVAVGQSEFFRHCRHRDCSHIVAGAAQSLGCAHCTQSPSDEQIGVDVPAHCALTVHWTHEDVCVLQ
jgi:hypothetical protein